MIIFVDIDDTICYSEESNLDYSKAKPYFKRINKINQLYNQGNNIVYWTARGTKTGIDWYKTTKEQLDKWGCKYNQLKMGKPVYDLFIDDKNINSDVFFNR